MKISTKARYGLRLMVDLAGNYGNAPVFLKDIAQKEDISEKYLSLIVIPLRGAGLITSTRGAHGGYTLAKSPEKITVQDIFAVLEGQNSLVDCVQNAAQCQRSAGCATRDVWMLLEEKIKETLSAVNLASLVKTKQDKAQNNIMSNI